MMYVYRLGNIPISETESRISYRKTRQNSATGTAVVHGVLKRNFGKKYFKRAQKVCLFCHEFEENCCMPILLQFL